MPTLYEALQNQLAASSAQPLQASQDEIAKQLQLRQTGKAVGPTGDVKAANAGEVGALAQGQAALNQQQAQGAVQGQELANKETALNAQAATAAKGLAAEKTQAQTGMAAAQQQSAQGIQAAQQQSATQLAGNEAAKFADVNNAASNAYKKLAADAGLQTADIFQQFKQSNEDLAHLKDAAKLEQVGFTMALQDKKYTDEINRIGEARRLNDAVAFREESTRIALGDQMDRFLQDIGFKTAYNADERTFKDALAKIDINEAIKIMEIDNQQANQQAIVSGAVATVVGGAKTYYDSKGNPTSEAPPTENATDTTNGNNGKLTADVGQLPPPAPSGPSDYVAAPEAIT